MAKKVKPNKATREKIKQALRKVNEQNAKQYNRGTKSNS